MLTPNTRLKERYRILHIIGGGGFGYVYKAIDEVFDCSVAIKETREDVVNGDKLRKAFEREARLLRTLKHDCLPRVTDYFFQNQAQFLVMDFIEGEDFAARLQRRLQQHQGPFTYQEILPWAEQILVALEYLHNRPKPIFHRDIKPSNIKLADDGGVYLLDFGLAKGAIGQMSMTIEGQTSSTVPGFTREYAPLEQLQDTGTQPQGDLYALGATLYHLLTGQVPVSATQRDEALQRGEDDPLQPAHEVNPAIPNVVSQIISQALAVRWWNRIGSAKEMRVALKQACEEITAAQLSMGAQPDSQSAPFDSKVTLRLAEQIEPAPSDNVEQAPNAKTATRWHQLHRSWLAAGVALVLLISVAVLVRSAYPNLFAPAAKPDSQETQPSENLKPLTVATPADLKLKRTLNGHTDTIWSVMFSPDGSLAASASKDRTIILWDTKTWTPKFPAFTGHTDEVYSVAFSPDGRTLASGSRDTTIRLWDTQTGQPLEPLLREHTRAVRRVAFSLDGNFLASCSGEQKEDDKEIRLWYVRDGWRSKTLIGHEYAVIAIAFSHDSSVLASASYDNTLRLWNLRGDGQSEVLKRYDKPLTALAFSEDGKYIACGSRDKTIKLWLYQSQANKWVEVKSLNDNHKEFITSIAFSPDNKTLVSASEEGTIRVWNVADGTSKFLSLNQVEIRAAQRSVVFSPDGQTLMTGGKDKKIRLWQ
jgi:WD40 repeat protein